MPDKTLSKEGREMKTEHDVESTIAAMEPGRDVMREEKRVLREIDISRADPDEEIEGDVGLNDETLSPLARVCAWLSDRLPFAQTIYGKDGHHRTPYLTSFRLTPWLFRIGQLRLHVFHRGDADPDPHDHPTDFWTFPLITYRESALVGEDGEIGAYESEPVEVLLNRVRRFRLHYRPARYKHRVLEGTVSLTWWRYRTPDERRLWGFWVYRFAGRCWTFVPWRTYVYGEPPKVVNPPRVWIVGDTYGEGSDRVMARTAGEAMRAYNERYPTAMPAEWAKLEEEFDAEDEDQVRG